MNEAALCHDSATGEFAACKTGAIYSLSHRAARQNNLDADLVGRGTMTKKRKIQAKFGQNTSKTGGQCGRQTIQGKKKKKDKRCRDYPERYEEAGHPLVPHDDDTPEERKEKLMPGWAGLRTLSRGIVESEEEDIFISLNDLVSLLQQLRDPRNDGGPQIVENNSALAQKCRSVGFVSRAEAFQGLVKSLNAIKRAQDGKLFAPEKE